MVLFDTQNINKAIVAVRLYLQCHHLATRPDTMKRIYFDVCWCVFSVVRYWYSAVWKHDAIHKTGNTYYMALLSEDDRATATGNMYKNLCEMWTCGFWEQTDIQTYSHTHTHTLITILCTITGVKIRDNLVDRVTQVHRQCHFDPLKLCVSLVLFQRYSELYVESHKSFPPNVYLAPPLGWGLHQKRIPGLQCDSFCVMIFLAVLW